MVTQKTTLFEHYAQIGKKRHSNYNKFKLKEFKSNLKNGNNPLVREKMVSQLMKSKPKMNLKISSL